MTISPSGRTVAYRFTNEVQDIVVLMDIENKRLLTSVGVEKVKPQHLMFVDDDTLLLVASKTLRSFRVRGPWEHSTAWLLGTSGGKIRRLLDRVKSLYPAQSGLGRVVGVQPDRAEIYMPAYLDTGGKNPPYGLLRVGTKQITERVISRGYHDTIDWFVDANGQPLIREDFDNKKNLHQIYVVNENPYRLLFEEQTNRRTIIPIGLSPDYTALIFTAQLPGSDSARLYGMNILDGSVHGPLIDSNSAGIRRILLDKNRVVHGIEFDGFHPSYEFFDEALSARIALIQTALPGSSVRLVSWSDDFKRLVVHVSGGRTAGTYLMFEQGKRSPMLLSTQRDEIPGEHVAPVIVEEYPARDGLTIPALITAKQSVLDEGSAPLIVMPHGGPAFYDSVGFNWLAQYFASRGYLVLQPQFRGSDGFGYEFLRAGFGEWGRKMQTDLDDGVTYLVEKGLADPQRVCIVGSSYGGYAALAAGAFSPDLYRCHVSINGVSDVRRMLEYDRRRHGSDHWVVDYWEEWFGAKRDNKDDLDALSPIYHAESFSGPVLLIHGKDDTVVPVDQSRRMRKALKRARKNVKYVQLKGEDHHLSRPETRLETLRVIADFIDEHL